MDSHTEYGLPRRGLLVLVWAPLWIAFGLWAFRAGAQASVDTELYSRWADLLIAHDFNLVSYHRTQDFYIPPVLYMGWIVVVAILKILAGASWMKAVVFLNWLAFGAGSYVVLNAVRRTTASAASLLLAAILFFAAGDLLIFMPFVLSDLIFWGMASVTLVAGCTLATAEPGRAGVWRIAVAGSALVLFALVFRPGGLSLVAFWAAALASWFARAPFDRFSAGIVAGAAMLAAVALAWHAAIMIDPAAWPFGSLPDYFAALSREYHMGMLVDAPESNLMVEPADNWLAAMRLTTQKIVFFLTPWLPTYSAMHTIVNLAFFLPAYGLAIIAARHRARLSPSQRRAVLILMLFVLSSAAWHALIRLDYDHRYRLPLLPALIMLAGLGLEALRRPPPLD